MKLKLQSLKVMLLGLMVIMIGGVMALDPKFQIGFLSYFLMVIGLFMGIIGFWRED